MIFRTLGEKKFKILSDVDLCITEITVEEFSLFLSFRVNSAAQKWSYRLAGLNQSKAINHKSEWVEQGVTLL